MLKPVPMQRIRLIGLKASEGEALKLLQREGVLHINRMNEGSLEGGRPMPEFEAVSEQLVRIRGIRQGLGGQSGRNGNMPAPVKIENATAQAAALTLDVEILRIRQENDAFSKRLADIEKQNEAAARLVSLNVDVSALPDALDYSIVSVKNKNLASLSSALQKKGKHNQMHACPDGKLPKNTIVLVAAQKGADFSDEFAQAGAEALEWKHPGIPRRAMQKAKYEQEDLQNLLRVNQRKLEDMSAKYGRQLAALEEALSIDADRAEIASRFGESRECFYIDGWMRKSGTNALEQKLHEKFGRKVILQRADGRRGGHGAQGADGSRMPTVLDNPQIAGPFQYLVEMFSLPHPDEIDPTMLLAVFLPIMYGMIVGDAGYALISLILAAALIKISAAGGMLRQFASMWAVCALPAFIFGVLFDEYFGFSHKALLGMQEPLYTAVVYRVENVQLLLLISLFAGLIHLAIGFILGFINEWKHSKKHAIVKIGWLLVEIGGVFAVGGFMLNAFDAQAAAYGAGALGLGALIIIWGEGIVGIFEIPGLASNIMSYARIAAAGVAGVILAEIINELLLPDPKMLSTPMGILTFIFIAILYIAFHVFNTFIAMFESLIHGARLNVIEFYGKFYKGAGIRFVPFSAQRRFTADEE